MSSGWHRPPCQRRQDGMCFNQRGDIFTRNGSSLKLVDKLTYLGSGVSLIKTYINTPLAKAWTANDSLSVIWKSDLTDKINHIFSSNSSRVDTSIWILCMDVDKIHREKVWRQLYKNAASNTEQVLEAAPHKAAAVRPLTTHHENYQS